MKFLDTPNPNAKKIIINHNFEISQNLTENQLKEFPNILKLFNTKGVVNIFTGPNFITVTKSENEVWDLIIQDFISKLDMI